MVIAYIIFLFGIFGQLRIGVFAIFFLGLVLYLWGGYRLFKKSQFKESIFELLKAFFLFFLFVVAIAFLNKGMCAHSWDEFSHWADVVKAMFYIDDFATNPLSFSRFKDYPPGMPLLQYSYLVLNSLIHGNKNFDEWRLFFVSHIVLFSLFFPLLDMRKNKKIETVCIIGAVVFSAVFFFSYIFDSLYIDPYVSVVASFLMCNIMFSMDKDRIYDLSVIFGCAFLVILKDVGILFAFICCTVYIFEKSRREKKLLNKLFSIFPIISTFGTKLLWTWKLNHDSVNKNFSGKIDFVEFFKLLIYKNGDDYKQSVVNSAIDAFFVKRFSIGSISLSYFNILLIAFICVCVCLVFCVIKRIGKFDLINVSVCYIVSTLVPVLYAVFIGAMYAYKFTEYEAIHLASYERYMNMCFLFYLIVSLITLFFFAYDFKSNSLMDLVFVLFFVLFINNSSISNYINRNNIIKGQEFRGKYVQLVDSINSCCDETSVISILSRGDTGLDRYVMRYYCRPNVVNINLGYSLGGPAFDGDVWYTDISPDDYMNSLIDNGITHVAIVQSREDFIDNYGVIFENPNDIEANTLFWVDVNNRRLVKCDI